MGQSKILFIIALMVGSLYLAKSVRISVSGAEAGVEAEWDEETEMCIAKWKCGGSNKTATQKKMHLIGYAMELALGLCLSPLYDVSSGIGFEGCHGEVNVEQ